MKLVSRAALAFAASSAVAAGTEEALFSAAVGGECFGAQEEDCSLNLLQRRGAATMDDPADSETAEAAAEGLRAMLAPAHRYNASRHGRRAPHVATAYDGLEDRRHHGIPHSHNSREVHVFAIGDWGTALPGHFTAPNSRGKGHKCPENCGYVHGVDDQAQLLVAAAMKRRAATSNPQYVLNVGDNFYWSGIEEKCNNKHATKKTIEIFATNWQGVYGDLANKPWISALGNHDYGGFVFDHGWPQQIGYSFVNHNWVMPGRYFSKKMYHHGFSVEYFVIDSNTFDAHDPDHDPDHNICSSHNDKHASCAVAGGPRSLSHCKNWFHDSYRVQQRWLQHKLAASKANWQVVVTHFPCGHDAGFYRNLHLSYGLDLLVTGHRHEQELWTHSPVLGGMTCFVTGGGGGVTSEHSPHPLFSSSQYGFFDLTISKNDMKVEMVAIDGTVLKSSVVYPKRM